MSKSFWYVIPGINPTPWTSPTVSVGRKNGKPYPQVYSSAELKNYKTAIADEVRERYPDAEVIEDEIALRLFFWRRVELLDRGGGKARRRGNVADATNMQKATEDALQGVLFKNDRQVVHAESWVMAQHDAVEPLVVVEVVWHPERPELPEHVSAVVADHPTLAGTDPNEHDVPVEDFI